MWKKVLAVLALVAGAVIAIALSVLRALQDLPGDRGAAQQAGKRLADGQAGVADAQAGIDRAADQVDDAQRRVDDIIASADRGTSAVDDGLDILADIKRRGQ